MARLKTTTPILDSDHTKCPNCNNPFTGVAYYTAIKTIVSSVKLKSGETVNTYRYSEITHYTGGYCRNCDRKNQKSSIKYCIPIILLGIIIIVFGVLNAVEVITLLEDLDAVLPILGGIIVVAIGIVGIILFNKASTSVYDKVFTEMRFIDNMTKDNNLKVGLVYMTPTAVANLKPEEKTEIKAAPEDLAEPGKSDVAAVNTENISVEDIPQSTRAVWNELNGMGFTVSVEEVYAVVQAKRNEFKARKIAYFGSDFELALGTLVQKEIPDPYEGYAKEIVNIFSKPLDKNTYQSQLRNIGEKIDHNHKQILVVKRAEFLCRQAVSSGNLNAGEFSISTMEYAWAGLGGWMP